MWGRCCSDEEKQVLRFAQDDGGDEEEKQVLRFAQDDGGAQDDDGAPMISMYFARSMFPPLTTHTIGPAAA